MLTELFTLTPTHDTSVPNLGLSLEVADQTVVLSIMPAAAQQGDEDSISNSLVWMPLNKTPSVELDPFTKVVFARYRVYSYLQLMARLAQGDTDAEDFGIKPPKPPAKLTWQVPTEGGTTAPVVLKRFMGYESAGASWYGRCLLLLPMIVSQAM